ncbi:MAG: ADP-ribosylglycohydrolase family protein [Bacteroidetes bacterium]|nr:ADP-ribosylglycohydrolase family protein [Bacteroidota bacterium]MCH8523711.1 ADP-ribosylglycohydrolase family protein [Balneolales bacterium]
MSSNLNDRFLASCLAASLGESFALPAEGMTPDQVKSTFTKIENLVPRPESETFYALPAGSTARQTEAMLAVLKASRPLPDLQGFAFNIKDSFNRFQMLWPKSATFPWPPFPDEGHYTFAFAMPAAYRLCAGKNSVSDMADWLKSLSPVSVVWQQGVWIYLRLLADLFKSDPSSFDKIMFVRKAIEYADEAEVHFPHDYKMKRRMQLTEPLLSAPLDKVAEACGNINNNADNVLAFVGSAFFKYHNSFEEALVATSNLGGTSGAVGFYLGSLLGALHGKEILPGAWLGELKVKESVEAAVFNYAH